MSTKRTGRCVCGLRVALHYDRFNHKLSCEETQRVHPRAHKLRMNLQRVFLRVVKESNDGQA